MRSLTPNTIGFIIFESLSSAFDILMLMAEKRKLNSPKQHSDLSKDIIPISVATSN
jgi:hypothetical protein